MIPSLLVGEGEGEGDNVDIIMGPVIWQAYWYNCFQEVLTKGSICRALFSEPNTLSMSDDPPPEVSQVGEPQTLSAVVLIFPSGPAILAT